MGLETGTYIDSLVTTNPASTDGLAQADDHIRLLKITLKNTFPNLTGPVTATQTDLNNPPSSLTDLGITDGTASGQVLTTDGSGNFSFTALPVAAPDTNYYVTGGSVSGTTLTLNREGLDSVSISGLPAAVTDNNQLANGAGYITAASVPDSLGVNQTWQSPSRSISVIYQNTTGKPIQVSVGTGAQFTIGLRAGASSGSLSMIATASYYSGFQCVIPDGYYYEVYSVNGGNVQYWNELR